MILALIIRLMAGYVQSFSNDELSALYRLQFNNFHDLIHWGVKVDGHPALVQLFLYAYTPLVGKSELLIRLPFILASTLSLGYIFFSLKKLSGELTAYMVVIILAFAGFSIQLGYFARPYALGILFTSMATYYWINIFIEQKKGKKYMLLFIFASILACYTHYFALLEIAMLGMAAFLFSPIKLWWRMIIAGGIVLLAYLPNYPILSFQLSVGGIGGWLGKPKDYFLVEVVLEYFDRNPIIIGVFVLFPLLVVIIQPAKPVLKRIALYLFLSLVPFALLYFYSININSLLQFSACFFLMPFLLAAFFSLFESGKPVMGMLKSGYGICMVFFLGSVFFMNSAFAPIHFGEFKRIAKYIEEHESDSVTTVVAINNPFYIDWYLKDKKPDLYITDMGDNLNFFKKYLDTCKTEDIVYAFTNQRSNLELPFIIKDEFPIARYKRTYLNSELYHFTKKITSQRFLEDEIKQEFILNDENETFVNVKNMEHQYFTSEYSLLSKADYSPTFTMKLSDLKLQSYDHVIASAYITGADRCDLEIVISVENEKESVFWRSRKLSYQYGPYDNFEKDSLFRFRGDRFNKHRFLVIAESLNNTSIDLKNHFLKIYLWNPAHCQCSVSNFRIYMLEGDKFSSSYSQ